MSELHSGDNPNRPEWMTTFDDAVYEEICYGLDDDGPTMRFVAGIVAERDEACRERDAYRTAAETLGKVARDNRLAQAPAAPACGDAWCACHP